MKTFLSFVYVILALFAFVTISLDEHELNKMNNQPSELTEYAIILMASIAYLQWFLKKLLVPLDVLPSEIKIKLKNISKKSYNKNFFRGTIGFGYLLIVFEFLKTFQLKGTNIYYSSISINTGLFLIGIGTLAQLHHQIKTSFFELYHHGLPPAQDNIHIVDE